METFIELTEDDLSQIAGGSGAHVTTLAFQSVTPKSAFLSFTQIASGVTFGHVSAAALQSVTGHRGSSGALLTSSAG